MKNLKRIFLIVLDSCGIGAMPDAANYGDAGADTLRTVSGSERFKIPNLVKLGISNIDGLDYLERLSKAQIAGGADFCRRQTAVCRLSELSKGKDTTVGHWEIGGIVSERPFPVYPEGFPQELIDSFSNACGRGVICNKPYSGTEVIKDFGEEHIKTGKLIVYTSADSVFQIAAHEAVVPIEELYRCCKIARGLLCGEHGVGRVIARPFEGDYPFRRTSRRHDFSMEPPMKTVLDAVAESGRDCIAVGKIKDIFAGRGITEAVYTSGNADGMAKTIEYAGRDFYGLCFVNLVDYDMLYGHRNDIDGYAAALTEFDKWLPKLLNMLHDDDLLMITADHGCDPGFPGTDHTREYVPLIMYGALPFDSGAFSGSVSLGTRGSFSDIAATISEVWRLGYKCKGRAISND